MERSCETHLWIHLKQDDIWLNVKAYSSDNQIDSVLLICDNVKTNKQEKYWLSRVDNSLHFDNNIFNIDDYEVWLNGEKIDNKFWLLNLSKN